MADNKPLSLTAENFEIVYRKMSERKRWQSPDMVWIVSPHVKSVIDEGSDAARVGQKYNPYQKNTLAHDMWDLGYDFPQNSGR